MANVGCRIYTKINRPDKSLLEGFRGLPVANIDDCMGRIACCNSSLKPMNHSPLLGTAFTVHCPEGDNLTAGLETVSANTALVLGRKAFASSSLGSS